MGTAPDGAGVLIVACVLRSGGEYKPEHVTRLRAQVSDFIPDARFVCLSDVDVDCERIDLVHNWAGWWSKIELFRPGLFDEPVVYLDLDTDVVADFSEMERGPLTMCRHFFEPDLVGSGVMAWGEDLSYLYETFKASPERHMDECRVKECWGDQGFISKHYRGKPDVFWSEVVSHKLECVNGVPDGAKIVAYHGRPKPWDV